MEARLNICVVPGVVEPNTPEKRGFVVVAVSTRVRREPGVDDPIPILPFDPKLNMSEPVDDAIANAYGFVEVPNIASIAIGEVVPIPMFPLAEIEKSEAPVEDATLNGLTF